MNTNIATKEKENKKVGIVSRIIKNEGKNNLEMDNVFNNGVPFKKNKKTDNFNENYILDLIKINLETNKLLKDFIMNTYSGTKAEKEDFLKECYFEFEKKKVFKFSENLTESIKKEFNPLNFDKILDYYSDYIFKNLKKYKYFYFFLYLLNSSNRRTENNITKNLPIMLQSIFSFFDVIKNDCIVLLNDEKEIKEHLKEKLELWVKKKEIGTTYQEFTVRWNYKRITKNITDNFIKEVNKVSIKKYQNYSEMRNPYLQKSLYLVYIISLNNMFKYFDLLNKVVKECLFKEDLLERMILKKGIIYRYEKDYSTNKKLTKERYDLLKSIENELLKEGRKIW